MGYFIIFNSCISAVPTAYVPGKGNGNLTVRFMQRYKNIFKRSGFL